EDPNAGQPTKGESARSAKSACFMGHLPKGQSGLVFRAL
ncbi:MAG: hypothetical protein ACI9C2_001589, partial [Gammaproteobacteria bacterium]